MLISTESLLQSLNTHTLNGKREHTESRELLFLTSSLWCNKLWSTKYQQWNKINIQDTGIWFCSLTTSVLTNATYSCLKQLKMAGEKSMQTPGGFKMFSIISSTGCFHGNLRPELSVDLHPTRSYSKALISSHNVLCTLFSTSHVYFSPHTYIDIIQINISHSMVFESTLMLFWIRDQIIFLWLFITLSFPIQRLWRRPRCTSDSPDHFNYRSC